MASREFGRITTRTIMPPLCLTRWDIISKLSVMCQRNLDGRGNATRRGMPTRTRLQEIFAITPNRRSSFIRLSLIGTFKRFVTKYSTYISKHVTVDPSRKLITYSRWGIHLRFQRNRAGDFYKR